MGRAAHFIIIIATAVFVCGRAEALVRMRPEPVDALELKVARADAIVRGEPRWRRAHAPIDGTGGGDAFIPFSLRITESIKGDLPAGATIDVLTRNPRDVGLSVTVDAGKDAVFFLVRGRSVAGRAPDARQRAAWESAEWALPDYAFNAPIALSLSHAPVISYIHDPWTAIEGPEAIVAALRREVASAPADHQPHLDLRLSDDRAAPQGPAGDLRITSRPNPRCGSAIRPSCSRRYGRRCSGPVVTPFEPWPPARRSLPWRPPCCRSHDPTSAPLGFAIQVFLSVPQAYRTVDSDMKTILVMDDSSATRTMLQAILTAQGYQAVLARNCTEGFAAIEQCVPDLVLLDLMMPGRTGLEFLKFIHSHGQFKDLPVIVISGKDKDEWYSRVKRLGVRDYLVKSHYTTAELVSRVHHHLSRAA